MLNIEFRIMKFFNIKYLLLCTTYLLLLSGCKRKCQDEKADNFEKGDRKAECKYVNADDWIEEIIIDSILINGAKLELFDENWQYGVGKNSFSANFDGDKFLNDTLKSITYNIGVPIGSDFTVDVDEFYFNISYSSDTLTGVQILIRNQEIFTFIEERIVNGVTYYSYKVELQNIDDEAIIDKNNFLSSYILIYTRYDVYRPEFSVIISNR